MSKRIAVVIFVLLMTGCSGTIGSTLKTYKYAELRPPTNLIPPGTLVEVVEENPLVINIVCTQGNSLGVNFRVPESPTYNYDLVNSMSRTFEIDSGMLNRIRGEAKYKNIKKIKMTFSNVKISQLSADTVYASLNYRAGECQKAVDDYINDKRKITMVTPVLKADVTYDIEFEHGVDIKAELKEEIYKDLTPKLGLGIKNDGKERMSGEGLYWGIRDDARFATLRSEIKTTKLNIGGNDQPTVKTVVKIPMAPTNIRVAPTAIDDILDKKNRPIQYIPDTTPNGVNVLAVTERNINKLQIR